MSLHANITPKISFKLKRLTMKKYYVIKLAFDHGFWSEEKQDFVGWLNATKYDSIQFVQNDNCQILKASNKKPCCVVEVFGN